jgi:hypothetical protein
VLRARLTRADRWALVVLVLLPVVLNLGWALAGHPVLDGDNLTQNYPLRALAGQLIAHWRLPLWDPGIWSGVPLLAGWNAGAMFPGTLLFAIGPGVAAYEVNVIASGIACGVGFHLFLRRSGCSPLASLLGALTWSETGFMSGQVVHLGLIQGTSLAPFILLAIDGVFRARAARAPSGHWVALLGIAAGLVVLAGDPRAASNDAIIAAVYLAARCWMARRSALRPLRDVVAGAALAVAVSAVQWLPGLVYLHSSQRSASSLAFFGLGSLGWSSVPLLGVPYLLGGNGNFSMPMYAGPFNLPEVTYAVGILPLIALFALIPSVRRRQAADRGVAVWYAMFVVGAVLSAGTKTPLGHLLVHIPLFGGERLQNRNAAICDFALAVLLAVFVDRLRPKEPTTETSPWPGRARSLLGAVPVAAVLGLVAAMFVTTGPMERWLGFTSPEPRLPDEMAPYYAVAILIALGGLVVLLRRAWRSPEGRRRAAAAVVVADVLVFVVMASYQPVPLSTLSPSNAPLTAMLERLPPGTRVAIDDPDQLALDYPQFLTDDLGVNDLVLLHGIDSVEGYGSAVPAAYEDATGTHDVENLLPSALVGPTYDDLDLGLLIVVPEQFGSILAAGAPIPVPHGPPVPTGTSAADRQPGGVARAPYPPAGPWRLGPRPVTWQLPAPTGISAATIAFDGRYGPVRSAVSVTVSLADGRSLTEAATLKGTDASVSIPSAAVSAGGGAISISVRVPRSLGTAGGTGSSPLPAVGAVVVTAAASSAPLALRQPSSGTVRFVLDGLLQGLLTPPHWVYAGHVGPLVLYRDTKVRGPAWLEAPGATSSAEPTAAGSLTTRSTEPWQDPTEIVDAPSPVLLVRSEQYSPGWSVSVQRVTGPRASPSGRTVTQAVVPVGLVQGTSLQAGRWIVTWHYHSTRAEIGLAAGVVGWLACAGLAVAGLRERRRRRR